VLTNEEKSVAKCIGLVVKKDLNVIEKAAALEQWLQKQGCQVLRKDDETQSSLPDQKALAIAPPHLFCVLVLGGDGTFLSAVRWLGDRQIPILGVKYGEVGFLAEATEEHLYIVLRAVLNEQFNTSQRMRLTVEVRHQEDLIAQETVLNDVVINKGALARLAHIKTYVNDGYLTDYRADGLIVASPTGSTAYSLAAGGPIIHPAVAGILITPICPFTLTNRPLIVPDSACIKIQLAEKATDIMLTFDGQIGLPLNERHTILVYKAPSPVNLITLPDRGFFDVLKAKLRWGGSRV
jgi:NAD+ kinase